MTDAERTALDIIEDECISSDADVETLRALVAERDRLVAERDAARRWYVDNFASDEDEPPAEDLTLTQMIERVFSWGNSAWGQAGAQHERAEAAEAERDRLREHANRMMAQVDELTEQRIERNAEIVVLRQALERVAREGSPDDASFARAVLDRLVSRGGV